MIERVVNATYEAVIPLSLGARFYGTSNRDRSGPLRRAALRLVGMLLLEGHDLSVQVRDGGHVVIRAEK